MEGQLPHNVIGYAKIGDLKGDSTDPEHKEWFEIEGLTYGVQRELSSTSQGGLSFGALSLDDVRFVIRDGREVGNLMKLVVLATTQDVLIHLQFASGADSVKPFLELHVESGRLTGADTELDGEGQTIATYSLTPVAGKVEWNYRTAPHTPSAPITTSVQKPFNESSTGAWIGSISGNLPVPSVYSSLPDAGESALFGFTQSANRPVPGGSQSNQLGNLAVSQVTMVRSVDLATLAAIRAVMASGPSATTPHTKLVSKSPFDQTPLFWIELTDVRATKVSVSGLTEVTSFAYESISWLSQPKQKGTTPEQPTVATWNLAQGGGA